MPIGGAVKLTIDNGKVGYVRLPNGGILTTVAGVIDTTYSGVGGAITFYSPKNSTLVDISGSDVHGAIIYNGASNFVYQISSEIESLTANNTDYVDVTGDSNLTELKANLVVTCLAVGCALTAKSIGDILYQAYIDNRENIVYDFSGGTNASETLIETYFDSEYGLVWSSVYNQLVTVNGGTITLNL